MKYSSSGGDFHIARGAHPSVAEHVARVARIVRAATVASPSVLSTLLVTACASAQHASQTPNMSEPISPLQVGPMHCPTSIRPNSEKREGYKPPSPDTFFILPTPPGSVRGKSLLLQLFVDEKGRNFADSATVCGLRGSYAEKIVKIGAHMRFQPALQDGVAVAAKWISVYSF